MAAVKHLWILYVEGARHRMFRWMRHQNLNPELPLSKPVSIIDGIMATQVRWLSWCTQLLHSMNGHIFFLMNVVVFLYLHIKNYWSIRIVQCIKTFYYYFEIFVIFEYFVFRTLMTTFLSLNHNHSMNAPVNWSWCQKFYIKYTCK